MSLTRTPPPPLRRPGRRPSPPRNASCQRRPWLHTEYVASRSAPSTCCQAPCRPRLGNVRSGHMMMISEKRLTELDTGVVLADLVTLLVGKEHVGRETTLGRVGVCNESEWS
jgi:hypothetical protein